MKKLLIIILALAGMQLSAQNKKRTKTAATEQSSSINNNLATEQVAMFSKKLNLTEAQQKQASAIIVTIFESKKFQKLIGTKSDSNQSDFLNNALLEEPEFNMQLSKVLSEEQKLVLHKLNAR